MPPPPGQIASTVPYFRAYSQQLREPLSNTLPLATIDKRTLSDLFGYQFTGLDNGSAAITLTPVHS